MTTTHYAMAVRHLVHATYPDSLTQDQRLAAAQANATLSLSEQQRIANLIALASLAGREDVQEELSDAAYESLGQLITYKTTGIDDEVLILRPTIAAALGIEEEVE